MSDLLSTRILNQSEVRLNKFNEITILEKDKEKPVAYDINKGANKYMYKQLGISNGTSKELYKVNKELWEKLIDYQLSDKDGRPAPFKFEDSKVRYIVDSDYNLVDMSIMQDDYCNQLQEKMDIFNMEINSVEHTNQFFIPGDNGLIKIVLYRSDSHISEDEYTPIVILEINNKKAEYSVYSGILIYKSMTFIPSMNPVATYQSYIDFILGVNILGTLSLAEDNAEGLYNSYQDFKSSHIEISARELIRILNKVGYKLVLRDDMSLDDIDKLRDEESNTTIKNFFNSFVIVTGETAEDILNLSEVKKIFKYNKLTIVDLLEILSKEYLNEDGGKVTAQILSDLVFGLYTKKTDVVDAKAIIDDVENR